MNTTIQNTLRAATFFLFGALTLSALQATARAAGNDLPSQRVSYADLDISKPAGAKVLYSRIVAAANKVCGFDGYKDIGSMNRVQTCKTQAIDRAVRDVGSPALGALRASSAIHLASN